ncbi:PadR family transcriptional regulator [Corynebacterium mendelii]|uniref:PadR family transcriptional regulator n=1 Tax=Corynebacterium mendelii TaxID=2765362 RepID=A0A939E019_9CORY|nr:PadR family transcriptional regulator [Corynebacterium mendelii]MBN9644424.1 PadR family transcriptional regulator [Corynebacterium mendelii]
MSVKHALLSALALQPCGVGKLRRVFEDATVGTWPINVGQVYQTVQRLERDGLVHTHGELTDPDTGRSVDIYAVTATGEEEIADWFSTPVVKSRNDRDELVIKIAMAAAAGKDVAGVIQAQREAVIAEIRDILQEKALTDESLNAKRLTLEKRIFDLEGEARWLDHIETLPPASAGTETNGKDA